jgi:hypothetical protein
VIWVEVDDAVGVSTGLRRGLEGVCFPDEVVDYFDFFSCLLVVFCPKICELWLVLDGALDFRDRGLLCARQWREDVETTGVIRE